MASIALIGCNKSPEIKTSTSEPVVTLPNQIQMGIESIIEKNGKVEINVYALNDQPIAGVQLEINPADIFKIEWPEFVQTPLGAEPNGQ